MDTTEEFQEPVLMLQKSDLRLETDTVWHLRDSPPLRRQPALRRTLAVEGYEGNGGHGGLEGWELAEEGSARR